VFSVPAVVTTAPAVSVVSCSGLRPFRGKSCICSCVIDCATVDVVVWICCISEVTVTLVLCVPTDRLIGKSMV
jgi:hypothetical protein